MMCKHCGHPIGYHWFEGERCTCKGCPCPGYEALEGETHQSDNGEPEI